MIDRALDAMSDAVVILDASGRVVDGNARAIDMSGLPAEAIRGKTFSEAAAADAGFRERQPFAQLLDLVIAEVIASGRPHHDDDATRIGLGGEVVPISLRINPMLENGRVLGCVMVVHDHALEASMMFRRASVGMAHIDRSGNVREANDALLSLLGRADGEVRAHPFLALVHPADVPLVEPALQDIVALRVASLRVEARFVHANGGLRWVDLSISGNGLGNDRVGGAVAILQDITDRVTLAAELAVAHDKLRQLAHHDPLTGLANRARLADDVAAAQARAATGGGHVGVLFIDLDGFKQVNDTDGHDAGDTMLVQVGERLANLLRPGDSAARIGGDEFVVCCGELAADPEEAQREAEAIATRVRTALNAPFEVRGRTWTISASVGIALSAGGSRDVNELLRLADVAMYRDKPR